MGERDRDFGAVHGTYRLQFSRDFTFPDALALVPYLATLGISHVYASPLMQARPGSLHGYDVVDHNRLNPELGSEDDFRAFVAALHSRGMGLILDFVPNHVGIGENNAWWVDVLEWGRESSYAPFFDINWDAARDDLKGRVLLPVLGEQYGAVLEKGEITLGFDAVAGSFSVSYYEHRWPISPRSYGVILASGGAALAGLAGGFDALPRRQPQARAAELQRLLAEAARNSAIAQAIAAALALFSGQPGIRQSFRRLHRLLEDQYYRLAYWRVAAEEINYRRFFNINDLAALRVEVPAVFKEIHRLLFALADCGDLAGLRIDHVDGLFDPAAYCRALRERCGDALYLVVEKILARYETLPPWPVNGTTGYDFLNQVLGIFVDPAGEASMTRLYRRLTRRPASFDEILYASKRRIMEVTLSSEMNVLARRFHRLSMSDWRTRDFTFNAMLAALEEVVAAFPIYRTYVAEGGAGPDDIRYFDWALGIAKRRWRASDTTILDFIYAVLTARLRGEARPDDVLRTAMQFQQLTGAIMAKSYEDTAFYRYFRLLALNEVGGDPRRFGISVAAFHHLMQERARSWPRAMLATATHDTKRGEDARLRLALLSEMPREWRKRVFRWLRINRRLRSEVDGDIVPSRNIEYLFYQTLVGAWPSALKLDDSAGWREFAERIDAYMIKAVREGKEESSWSNPDIAYEAALQRFVAGALDATRPNPFLADFAEFIGLIARPAAIASLSQLVLKLTAPGIPDIYQGGELWDLNLVDPDNRRPVDWPTRKRLADAIANEDFASLGANWRDGREKLFVMNRLLDLRRRHPGLFIGADYQSLELTGPAADAYCAFLRRHGEGAIAATVPRLLWRLHGGGSVSEMAAAVLRLPGDLSWRDIFTGRMIGYREHIEIRELLAEFPVSVLYGT